MVNFADKLSSNIVPEWSENYIDYNALKKMLKRISRSTTTPSFIRSDSPQIVSATKTTSSLHITTADDIDKDAEVRQGLLSEDPATLPTDAEKAQLVTPGAFKPRARMKKWYGSLDGTISRAMTMHADRVRYESEYQDQFQRQVLKVEAFYLDKLESLQASYDLIVQFFKNRENSKVLVDCDVEENDRGRLSKEALSVDSIKRTCIIIYRKLMYLKNFAVINYTACVKISKKHDKTTGFKTSKQAMSQVALKGFSHARAVQSLLDQLETQFADAFCAGDATVGRSELLMKHWAANDWQMLHIGLRIGAVLVLALWTMWDTAMDASRESLPSEVARVYRGLSCFVLASWCWAAIVYMWHSAHVNYVYLFELDPRHTLHYIQIIMQTCTVTLMFLVSMLMYVKISRQQIFGVPAKYAMLSPLLLFIYMGLNLFFPWSQRRTLITALGSVITAPFGEVSFFSAYVGDLLTSIVKPLNDVAYAACFFFTGEWRQLRFQYDDELLTDAERNVWSCEASPLFRRWLVPLITSLPLWFRFAQNLHRYYETHNRRPHLPNAGKYALAFTLVLFGSLHPEFDMSKDTTEMEKRLHLADLEYYKACFIALLVLSTCITYAWDVRMDWGLGYSEHGFLRAELMYSRKWMYYMAVVGDLFLRFVWSLTLVPELRVLFGTHDYFISPIVAWLEICRRTMWSFFRVEHEHLHNTQGYRRVEVVPLHFDTSRGEKTTFRSDKREMALELFVFTALLITLAVLSFVTSTAED